MIDFQSVRKQIVALLPCYLPEGGNGCRVLLRNGQELLFRNRIAKVWNDYLMLWGLADDALEHAYAHGKLTPVPLTNQHTFLCLRVRKALVQGDSVYGYIEHESLDYPIGSAREALHEITCCGHHIEIITSIGHLQMQRQKAIAVQQAWQEYHNRPSQKMTESLLMRDLLIMKYKLLSFILNSEQPEQRLTEINDDYAILQNRTAAFLLEEPIQPLRK